MVDQATGDKPDEEKAEEALRQHDWIIAESFLRSVLGDDCLAGGPWLERFAAEARRAAAAGDAVAEFAVGNSELLRWSFGLAPAEPCLRSALQSFKLAAEATGSATVLEQVHHWYAQARQHGYSFADIEAFLADHPLS